jgi:uncharacterized membrane protein YbaN (DUF454 family)
MGNANSHRPHISNRGLRMVLVAAGLLSTGLGVIGIFLPLLPTVPLLLLAAACFARSSERFYVWLLEHRHLGPMIRGYLDGRGIPLRAKITAVGLVWMTISVSVLLLTSHLWIRLLLVVIGLCLTAYLASLPVREGVKEKSEG